MPDDANLAAPRIFISYKREEASYAQRVCDVLTALGYDVFWDQDVQLGQRWNDVLDRKLFEAPAVVVLWSRRSVASEWVKHEASIALARGVLLQLVIEDGIEVPVQYQRENHASLVEWDGDPSDGGFPMLLQRLQTLLGPAKEVEVTERARWPRVISSPERRLPWLALLAGTLGVAAGVAGGVALAADELPGALVAECRDDISRMQTLTRIDPQDDAYGNIAADAVSHCAPLMGRLEEGGE